MVCHAPQTSGRRKKFVGTCAEGNSGGLRNVKRKERTLERKGTHHETAENTRMCSEIRRRGENVAGDEGATVVDTFTRSDDITKRASPRSPSAMSRHAYHTTICNPSHDSHLFRALRADRHPSTLVYRGLVNVPARPGKPRLHSDVVKPQSTSRQAPSRQFPPHKRQRLI
jgi:hypothetical protein